MPEPSTPPSPSRPVLITGGTGFVGSAIARALSHHDLRILARHATPDDHGQTRIAGDVSDPVSLRGACDGVETLVHLVAIIEERGDATFDRVIRQGTENIINEAQRAGIGSIVYLSALGAHDNPRYPYHRAKWQAEQAIIASGIPHTILRPSIIFGPGDGFLTLLAGVVRGFPLTPVVGDGKAPFQPLHVGDVASIVTRAVDHPDAVGTGPHELGGPELFTFEELIDLIRTELGVRRPKVHLPVSLMRLVVNASSPLPRAIRPPVTREQLNMLELGNEARHSRTEELLGRPARSLRGSLGYLRGASSGGT
jgi:NADH dehydrogenase